MKKIFAMFIALLIFVSLIPIQSFAYYDGNPVKIDEKNFPDEGLREFFRWQDKYKGHRPNGQLYGEHPGNNDGYIYPKEWLGEYSGGVIGGHITNNLWHREGKTDHRKAANIKNFAGLDKVIDDPNKEPYKTRLEFSLLPLCFAKDKNSPDEIFEPIVGIEQFSLPDSVNECITKIFICRSKLSDINLKNCKHLTELRLSNDDNELNNKLFIQKAKKANKQVDEVQGKLSKIDLSECEQLTRLILSAQPIEKLDLSNNDLITNIIVNDCKLAKLDITNITLVDNPRMKSNFSNQKVEAEYEIKDGKIYIPLAELLEDKKYYTSVKVRESNINSSFDNNTGTLIYDTDDIKKLEDPGYDFVLKDYSEKEYIMDVHLHLEEDTPIPTNKVKVTFDSNGGSAVEPKEVEVEKGNTVSEPTEKPTLAEHKFLGWFTEKEGGDKWNFETDKVKNEMTLYAHWEKVKYEVKASVKGGTVKVKLTPDKAAKGENVKVNVTEIQEGKIIKSITAAGNLIDNGGTFTMPGEDVTVEVILTDKPVPTLEAIKAKLVKELESYKNPDDYREAEKELLKQEVKKGTEAISAASDEEKAKKALADAKAEIDKIKTNAQYIQEENERPEWQQDEDGSWYVIEKGEKKKGWYEDKETYPGWYFFDKAGKMKSGWHYDESYKGWFYLSNSGKMETGWIEVKGSWYYLENSGKMKTGWLELGGTWYYLKSSGEMASGWEEVNGSWYYFESSGAMKTGWLQLGNTWYYLKSSGEMATDWEKINGTWYRFASSGAWIS